MNLYTVTVHWQLFTRIAAAPSLGAGNEHNDPLKDPIGVLAAPTMTISLLLHLLEDELKFLRFTWFLRNCECK